MSKIIIKVYKNRSTCKSTMLFFYDIEEAIEQMNSVSRILKKMQDTGDINSFSIELRTMKRSAR